MQHLVEAVALGIGATAVMDAWGLLRRPLLGLPVPDYAMLGRWVGHMPRGRFVHASIARAPAVSGERWLGWTAHYLVGIGLAALLLALAGPGWLQRPTPCAALALGVGSVAAPFFVMQPAMGGGWAASRSPSPSRARLQSLATHVAFGAGLYLAALLLRHLAR